MVEIAEISMKALIDQKISILHAHPVVVDAGHVYRAITKDSYCDLAMKSQKIREEVEFHKDDIKDFIENVAEIDRAMGQY